MAPVLAIPPFENIRLATLADVPRIASVAAAGFFHSPSFQFQRRNYSDFADDTLSSYWLEYKTMVLDPASVVLVAEDVLDPLEDQRVEECFRKSPVFRSGKIPQAHVVVGICSLDLNPESPLIGRIDTLKTRRETELSDLSASLSNLNRDLCADAVRAYADATGPAKKRHLEGLMRLSSLAVHPACWRRGHAHRLVSWCTQLADMEGSAIGVSATPMGFPIALKAGFEVREIVRLKRLASQVEDSSDEVKLWIGVRLPSGSSSDASVACSESPTPVAQEI